MGHRKVLIPKKSGGFREIHIPNKDLKSMLKIDVHYVINPKQVLLCHHAHAFVPGRSAVTGAILHVGYRYTLSCDLVDFFDNCRMPAGVDSIRNECFIPPHILQRALVAGRPPQGFPTSPGLANIFSVDMDETLYKRLLSLDPLASYTRYADDMAFSSDDRGVMDQMRADIPGIVASHGHVCHTKKWSLQDARYGNREICGVSVTDTGVRATRRHRRKLRAAEHKHRVTGSRKAGNQARGLRAWCELSLPAEERLKRAGIQLSDTQRQQIESILGGIKAFAKEGGF